MTMSHKEALDLAIDTWIDGNRFPADMENAIRAYLDARGLAVVPREPTLEMQAAGSWAGDGIGSYAARQAYDKMLAAAPDPFGSE